jgi:hypothetical protein
LSRSPGFAPLRCNAAPRHFFQESIALLTQKPFHPIDSEVRG